MQKRRVYAELHREYERKRERARILHEAKIKEIHELFPEIKQIDDEIAKEGFKASFASLDAPENAGGVASDYKNRVEALTKQKNALLKAAGISKRHLELHRDCKVCGDTGYVDGKECRCFVRARIEKIYGTYTQSPKIRERFEIETFDNFDFRYYSSKKIPAEITHEDSPRKNMEKILKYCLKFVNNFGECVKKNQPLPNILFYGQPGNGKTYLCNAIARELMDNGHIVIYTDAFSLFNLISDIQFGRAEDSPRSIDDLLTADLLIIDDAGTEFSTALTGASFFNIINSRLIKGVSTIISSNLYPNDLKELYSERVYSRLVGSYAMFEFYGEDIRRLKKYGKFLE